MAELWIARHNNGQLSLHYVEPEKWANSGWKGGIPMWLDMNLFPEVTFENSPQKVKLKLIPTAP